MDLAAFPTDPIPFRFGVDDLGAAVGAGERRAWLLLRDRFRRDGFRRVRHGLAGSLGSGETLRHGQASPRSA